ncbi:thiopeptide-type bacteriocin biosynthesis protein [Streptomyces sp. NBC_01443]|uniref:thiopeptide-type bacteriocin biosynthesis protein n=1 Tax=Streptomyces sp. NBC_01443 TaxID=2903868 RepID=UPI00225C02D4|nr:thiopeptide-type bacteriocin biosynthesis protein [Streptomyces sp. NBC_01443]MCX4625514.1 thiopeptide-type bacteriocin biosynthesis protein [Streptomyces sp. NBC_01443]
MTERPYATPVSAGGAPAATTAALAPAPVGGWQSLHLTLHTDGADTDAFVTGALAPLMDGRYGPNGGAWFFIRYNEGGPHLRIRFRSAASPDDAAELAAELSLLAGGTTPVTGPWTGRHGEVRAVPYEPETERYGGPAALPVAEEVFVHSTRAAVAALRAVPARADRLQLALDLAHATAYALGLDELASAGWLRRHAASWRWAAEVRPLPGAAVHTRVNTVFAAQRTNLGRRARALRAGLDVGSADPRLAEWTRQVRAADARLRTAAPGADRPDAPVRTHRRLWVWASQLHMLFNRLGVTPDEERAVCRLAGRALLETGDEDGFFGAGPRAADYQYLEQSKFQIGRAQDTAVRSIPRPGVPSEYRPEAERALPAASLPELSLAEALRSRSSARGALRGPLTAEELGGVLWHAHAPSHVTRQALADGTERTVHHRPYPSAGALYSVRVRLLALSVAGLAPGTYHCMPERRSLAALGPAPDLDGLKALSSYLSRPAEDPDSVGIDEAPAVLAVHLDLGLLRRRYGLRALRLGLLEAGHLAQTLQLTAGAFGLATIPLGGLHDDLAHELLGLDDLDEPIQYLLPLGRLEAGRS